MRRMMVRRGLRMALVAAVVVGAVGQAVHGLWNLLMPEIFGLQAISFWQALGLLALSWILFGFGRFGRRHGGGGAWRQRWEQMPPEERERFRAGMARRCGGKMAPSES